MSEPVLVVVTRYYKIEGNEEGTWRSERVRMNELKPGDTFSVFENAPGYWVAESEPTIIDGVWGIEAAPIDGDIGEVYC